ncbi:MAG: heavy metal translocating P-type ATPase [Clostridia bacterium]|nr:heavy metal translocating P-type ATPase [Clostridia bacterium]
MKQYTVTGMSCAACSSRVEKAVSKVEGVKSCSVSLLTNSMGVEGDVAAEKIIEAVRNAGYDAFAQGEESKIFESGIRDDLLKDRETPALKKRLITSLVFLLLLMYMSMGYTMWGFPLPSFFDKNPVAVGISQMLLSLIVIFINKKFYVNGIKGVMNRAPNMDTLVSMGSAAAFVYSTCSLFAMTAHQASGEFELAKEQLHDFYFESSAMILVLITVGKMLEARSKGRTTDALKGLIALAPKTATVVKDGEERKVPVEEIKIGDIFTVRSGETVPVDGIIIDGSCAVNESSLTGESVPVDKEQGDTVSGATINQSGYIKCRATRVGEDTTLSQIIKMVSDAAATKAPIAKIADKVSGIFVPVVICIAIITIVIWLIAGQTFGYALARGISVLVISCPCALGLATPVAIMVGSGVGAKNGILFKTAVSLEHAGRSDIVVLDKTGTVTSGEPRVTDIIPADNCEKASLMRLAFSLECKSEHPLAKAIVREAEKMEISADDTESFKVLPGNGIECVRGGLLICAGNYKFISEKADVSEDFVSKAETLAAEGKTPLFFCEDGKISGIIAVADVIKEDSARAVQEMKNMGIRVVMLTGDNERTANAIGKQAGIDEVIAGVMPDGKESVIRELKRSGAVMMVGDGINDAPALTRADIGVAIGAGTDVAIDAADIVLMKSRLSDVPAAIRLSRATLMNIYQNLFWAFIYNTIGIPLAAGAFVSLFGWELNPIFGAASMSLSSFCVVSNALRLNFFKINNVYSDRKKKCSKKKPCDCGLQITIKIKGMMCGHCEATVKKALESLPSVENAEPDHKSGTVYIVLKSETEKSILKKTVEDAGYKFVSIV